MEVTLCIARANTPQSFTPVCLRILTNPAEIEAGKIFKIPALVLNQVPSTLVAHQYFIPAVRSSIVNLLLLPFNWVKLLCGNELVQGRMKEGSRTFAFLFRRL